jgi:Bacterial lectin
MIRKLSFVLCAFFAMIGLALPASASEEVVLTLNSANAVSHGWTLTGSKAPSMVRVAGASQEWALRLTDASGDQTGFALLNREISVAAGLDVTFHQSQWGGTGADGIVFFVKNANDRSTTPGALGGSLGYAYGSTDGLSGALLGLGLDTYGGFVGSGVGSDCTTGPRTPMYQSRDALTLRGAGQGRTGYCHLVEPWITTEHSAPSYLGAADRMSGARKIRVKVDSIAIENSRVQVFYEDVLAIDIPLPADFNNVSKVKIGFTAGSGGATNNHEVWGLQTVAANPELVSSQPVLANTGDDLLIELILANGMVLAGFLLVTRRVFAA